MKHTVMVISILSLLCLSACGVETERSKLCRFLQTCDEPAAGPVSPSDML